MIKIYGSDTCPDCIRIKGEVVKRNAEFEYIDILKDTKTLKEFIYLRDTRMEFKELIEMHKLGIPCFLTEDNRISFNPKDFGLDGDSPTYCSIEDHKTGKKGC